MTPRDVAAHMQASCAAIYEVFGEAAPTLSNDDFVVRAHELSRAFGARALQFRAHSGDAAVEPLAIIESVLREAVVNDQTGAMALFALVSVGLLCTIPSKVRQLVKRRLSTRYVSDVKSAH